MRHHSIVRPLLLALLLVGLSACQSNRDECEEVCRTFISTCDWNAWSNLTSGGTIGLSNPNIPNFLIQESIGKSDGFFDEIIKEPLGGAHRNYEKSAENLKSIILNNVNKLSGYSISTLIEQRKFKYDKIGSWRVDE